MSKLIIQGGGKLKGVISIAGMKNAATPILAACLLTKEECVLKNVPRIVDVEKMVEIIKSLGVAIEWSGAHEVTIAAKEVNPKKLNKKLVGELRSSILLAGPLIARTGSFDLPEPGGCIIGNRPLDTHVAVFEDLGVTVKRVNGSLVFSGKSRAADISLQEISVTATENALMAAMNTPGKTVLHFAAAEPHVQDLCAVLVKMGARIKGIGTHELTIEGVASLKGVRHTIIPDQIEIGTFAALAAATHSKLSLRPVKVEHIRSILLTLTRAGVQYKVEGDTLSIISAHNLRAFKLHGGFAMPYPGFPTDLQAPFATLATQCKGVSLIHDPLFEGRMGYVHELIKMGANAIIADPHRVIISGPTPLYGQEIKSLDLRAGATLVIAGLLAEGETVLHDAEVIDRGYEDIEGRLQAIGANIRRG